MALPSSHDDLGKTRRRQTLRLPRRRHHVGLAFLVLISVILIPLLAAHLLGSETDALPKGAVSVTAIPEDQSPSPLDADSNGLPDLLADIVPIGENPTEGHSNVDALGNPVTTSRTENDSPPKPKTIRLAASLPKAPPLDPSLTRDSTFGPIPGPGPNGRTPLEHYKAASPSLGSQNPVSLIIGGLGINESLTQRAIDELPPAVTLSFASQTSDLQIWIDRARARGHEVLLEIPMEGQTAASISRTLKTTASSTENMRDLHFHLSQAQGYVGLVNYEGQSLLRRSDTVAPILAEIGRSGLGLFIDGSFSVPNIEALATSISLPFALGTGLIDPSVDQEIINSNLAALSAQARQSDTAFGVGFAYPETIAAVKGWAATLASDNLVLVPASDLLVK